MSNNRGWGALLAALIMRALKRSRQATVTGRGAADRQRAEFLEGVAASTRDLTAAEIRKLRPSYAPNLDGDPDPGEVIWAWVPYVENDGRGKDRPILIIARIDHEAYAGCYLSTKQHRGFVSVGSGGWDSKGRESYLSPERVLRIEARDMRREGQILAQSRFSRALEAITRLHSFAK